MYLGEAHCESEYQRRRRDCGQRVPDLQGHAAHHLAGGHGRQRIPAGAGTLLRTAFGNNLRPSWADFQAFLEERCIPRQRAGLREYLEAIGVAEYDPLQIIRKTQGRMAEDQQWLEVLP